MNNSSPFWKEAIGGAIAETVARVQKGKGSRAKRAESVKNKRAANVRLYIFLSNARRLKTWKLVRVIFCTDVCQAPNEWRCLYTQ